MNPTYCRKQLIARISDAAHEVRLLGVVALDLDWSELAERWVATWRSATSLHVSILCESSNTVFARALTSDSEYAKDRKSFRELEFRRDRALKELPNRIRERRFSPTSTQLEIQVTHLPIPIPVVQVDGEIYYALWLNEVPTLFERADPSEPLFGELSCYLETYFDRKTGGRFAAESGEEILELFDHQRIPRGIYPRDSFYDTDYSQLVIWGLVFDRCGQLLLHRRKQNAKDNQSMWDKSVGGHVDFRLDVDTSRAMARELLEELFTDELKKADDGKIKAWTVSDEDVVFLGEWRPDRRGSAPMEEIAKFDKEWAFFRLRNSQHLYSPRTLPKGGLRRLRVIADVYLFVAGPGLTEGSLGEFKNSEFKLLELKQLKTAMDKALRGEEVPDFEKDNKIPQFTPDLVNIMTGELRDTLEEFVQHISTYLAAKS